jgi:hypothetical protein
LSDDVRHDAVSAEDCQDERDEPERAEPLSAETPLGQQRDTVSYGDASLLSPDLQSDC